MQTCLEVLQYLLSGNPEGEISSTSLPEYRPMIYCEPEAPICKIINQRYCFVVAVVVAVAVFIVVIPGKFSK